VASLRVTSLVQQNLIPIPIPRLLEETQWLKEAGHQAAVHFLKSCRSVDLLAKFPVGDVDCPLRSWVSWFCEQRKLRLSYARTLDHAQIAQGTDLAIHMLYTQFNQFIRSFYPQCIFVAGETMVDAVKGAKCTTSRRGSPTSVDFEHLPHVSAMCANNLTGTIIPPLMILPHHASTMHEFDDMVAANRAWICTTQNVCQMPKSFLI
jgi:hypothetical protein